MSRPSTTDVVIIGAGPYGLSVGADLRRHGLLIAGTGYRVDLGRLPFLGDQPRASTPGGRGARAVVELRGVGPGSVLPRVGVCAQFRASHALPHGADYSARRLVVISWPRSPGTRSPAPAVQ
jgi:hypothetical protein